LRFQNQFLSWFHHGAVIEEVPDESTWPAVLSGKMRLVRALIFS
jgi:hypothetical protein